MSGLNFATAYIDLAIKGGAGVRTYLADLRQQFRETTAAAQAFQNRLASPAGAASLQRTFAAQAQSQAAVLRAELAQGRARDAFEQSPEGRRAGAELRRLRQERDAQEEARRRRQVIDEYGRLGGRMVLFKEALGKALPVVGAATAAYATFAAAANYSLGLAGHANPAGAQHLEAAQEALRIQSGRAFLDSQRRTTAAFQRMAEEARAEPNPGVIDGWARGFLGSSLGRPLVALGTLFPDWMRRPDRLQREQQLLRRGQEFQGPFPSGYESFEGFGESLRLAGGSLTAQQRQNMQDQFNNFLQAQAGPGAGVIGALAGEEVLGVLARIADNTGRMTPAYR
jgi:hypothetical protein